MAVILIVFTYPFLYRDYSFRLQTGRDVTGICKGSDLP
ncbi:hypothetical protein EVA_17750 [gut metagenome]|uniref:Uncharacterized protein n=1 Tax=gut metagenome TaxID=749906 RepID=J9FI88_9ZZZZ